MEEIGVVEFHGNETMLGYCTAHKIISAYKVTKKFSYMQIKKLFYVQFCRKNMFFLKKTINRTNQA